MVCRGVRASGIAVMLLAMVWGGAPAARAFIFADGFESGDLSAWSAVVGESPKTFRFTDLDLRDPHVFAAIDIGVVLCLDFTDDPLPVVDLAFNPSLEQQINGDADGDGFLDLSSLLLFRPLDTLGVGERVDFDTGLCTDPAATTVCAAEPTQGPVMTSYDGLSAGTCLETVPGTTSGYVPAVGEPFVPCFVTVATTAPFQIGEVEVTLRDLQVSATFVGDPVSDLTTGLIRGFLSEADADAILLPPDLPLVGGMPISVLLPGGTGSCASGDDRDTLDGVSGWWLYFNYTATRVTYFGG